MRQRRSVTLHGVRYDKATIEKALRRMASGAFGFTAEQARRSVSDEGWIDINGPEGKALADLCEGEPLEQF